jgi:hypothetical protein
VAWLSQSELNRTEPALTRPWAAGGPPGFVVAISGHPIKLWRYLSKCRAAGTGSSSMSNHEDTKITKIDASRWGRLAMVFLSERLQGLDSLALLWQIFSGTGFPNQFFNDSWVVGFWRADHEAQRRIGKTSFEDGSSRSWIAWAINRGGECVRFMWQG